MRKFHRICVFCGSSVGNEPAYVDAAERLGATLAEQGIGLVYGGGCVGLMGVVADSVLKHAGEVIGVIPRFMIDSEVAHAGLTDLRVVNSMHERKAMMAELSDGFIALPGGFGTIEELMEIVTWSQLGLHDKPVALLNVGGFFDDLSRLIDRMVSASLLRVENRALLIEAESVPECLEAMALTESVPVPKWLKQGAKSNIEKLT